MAYNEIILASWLHDIPKFAHRAGINGSTGEILQRIKDYLPADVQRDEVIRLASSCYNPSSYDEWIIAHGERLSRGTDQDGTMLDNKDHVNEPSEKYYETALVHLVSSLHLEDEDEKTEKPQIAYTPLEELEGSSLFAVTDAKACKEDYKNLWEQFEKDLYTLKLKNFVYEKFIRSFDTLMERYTWCIPSSTVNDTDVSIYQHSKVSAAFAGALYLYYSEKKTPSKEPGLNENDLKRMITRAFVDYMDGIIAPKR
jgi:CRISPR-associated protein Csm1